MDISTLQVYKGELKLDISRLIRKFEDETRVKIKEMSISFTDDIVQLGGDGGIAQALTRNAKVDITLDI